MIKFMNMEIKGFCSIQDLSITLGTEGIHLVKGNNGSRESTTFNRASFNRKRVEKNGGINFEGQT